MQPARIAIVALALIEAGWMAFDGSRALLTGDYVTPASGPYAGQLGPWRIPVEAAGLDPRGTLMKTAFAAIGWSWLLVLVAFIRRAGWAWRAMLAAAVATLWYLPFGTLLSGGQIVLLVMFRDPRRRTATVAETSMSR